MAHAIPLRIVVAHPHPEVELRLQRGRDALVPPVARTDDAAIFEFTLTAVEPGDGRVVLRGPEAQGPPAARFVYVTAGSYAGQAGTPYNRRAKVPLGGLTAALVAEVRARPDAVLEATIHGRARDGGPAAASVPLLGDGWRIVPRQS